MIKTYTIHCFPHEGGRCSFQRNYYNDRAAKAWADEAFATGNYKCINLMRGRAKIATIMPAATLLPQEVANGS